jgi:uracil-DNA glycosylase
VRPPPSERSPAEDADLIACRRCPRLVEWREASARTPPKRFAGERYWAHPIPAFGDRRARLVLIGLAPAAHGGNRTGRIFTGDASGDFLFRALHAVGLANQPTSVGKGDGLTLSGVFISAACRCAPPGNRPRPEELDHCRPYLSRDLARMGRPRVLVALGALAFDACLGVLAEEGAAIPRPRPRFAHGARLRLGEDALFATYHPSQQNTFTGVLTQGMLRKVLRTAIREAGR